MQDCWWHDPNWVSAIGTVAATIVAALAIAYSIFRESFWTWWRRPRLAVSLLVSPPDCEKTEFTDLRTGIHLADCYYFRIRVANRGKRRAESVEIFAKQLEIERDGRFAKVQMFPPMDLLWAHIKQPELSVSPGVEKHCDLGFIVDPSWDSTAPSRARLNVPPGKCLFTFEVQAKPNHGGNIIGPGRYRLVIVVASANTPSLMKKLDLRFTGDWYKDQDQMFDERNIHIEFTH